MGLKNRDPFEIFNSWMDKASRSEHNNPNAMTLATCGKDGRPSARMVLLKDISADGFTFYTNLDSQKSHQIVESPFAALLFHWKTLNRQIRIEGAVEQVSDAEADAYFATRPRASQLGAWASHQSQPLNGWAELEKRLAMYTTKFHVGPVPRPEFWSGFRLHPERFEFWKEGNFRLHKRFVFTPSDRETGKWDVQQVFP
ncbi:MAG: pyridoxamine 5'-phosphate oxidase [Xanthomonadales bacterium]|nr:pyridoxamine 5'-phosphate oxidase [Xanthomonadales bacterium]